MSSTLLITSEGTRSTLRNTGEAPRCSMRPGSARHPGRPARERRRSRTATMQDGVPPRPVPSYGGSMGNPITWFEILGADPEAAASFYAELFGWSTEPVQGGYILIDTHAGGGMNGGIARPSSGRGAETVFYAQGPDVQALLDLAGSLGATVESP